MNALTISRPRKARLPGRRSARSERVPIEDGTTAPFPAEFARHWASRYGRKVAISDLVWVTLAIAIANLVRFVALGPATIDDSSQGRFVLMSFVVLVVWFTSLALFRTRDRKITGVGLAEYQRVINATTTIFGVLAIGLVLTDADAARWFLAIAFPIGAALLLSGRWLWRRNLTHERSAGHSLWRVIVVGRRADVEKVVRQINASSGAAYRVVSVILQKGDSVDATGPLGGLRVGTGLERVAEYASSLGADGVVVAGQPRGAGDFVHDLAWQLEGRNVELILATSLANVAGPRLHFRPVDGLPLLHVEIPQFEGGKHAVKRALDVVVSGCALLCLAPLFLVLAVLIRLDSPGTVLFTQERVGRDGATFKMLKFRSMVEDAPQLLAGLLEQNESNGVLFKIRNDPRITRLGRILRKYSLDELPQFWNVFVGDMSLVGPRPPLAREVETYEAPVARRLYIKPGLTGMWQVNGRSELSWEDSVRLDLYYVENWSIIGDLIILWRTLKVVVHPVGAY